MPLVAILLSLLWTAVSFILRTVVIKFLVFTAIYVLLLELFPILFSVLDLNRGVDGVLGSTSYIPASVWFFLDAFSVNIGIPIIMGAYITRFTIRRIPFIG